MGVHDAAEAPYGLGHVQVVQLLALEVANQPTAHADIVVVRVQVRIEPHPVALWSESRDEPEVVQRPEGPVDRVQRDRRDAPLNGTKYSVSVRVLDRGRNLAEDLESLVRHLASRASDDGDNVPNAPFCLS